VSRHIFQACPVSQQIWTPLKMDPPPVQSASEYGPVSPYLLANMDLCGSLFACRFALPSRIWTPHVFLMQHIVFWILYWKRFKSS
jgi:hypothetical protein